MEYRDDSIDINIMNDEPLEISLLSTAGINDKLLFYYPLDTNITPIQDVSGNGRNGTPAGSVIWTGNGKI
ncbi:MAG: hypothetical protein LBI53_04280 [Candidatus Peribacteria bacterium]|nr:hypothetical protein [Candidatus Peribacteria bacterium]